MFIVALFRIARKLKQPKYDPDAQWDSSHLQRRMG